jgi:hypothetical protein
MDSFPSLRERTSEELHELLFQAVSRGKIRAMLNEAVVPKAHINVILTFYIHCAELARNSLPADLALSYGDLCTVFEPQFVETRELGGLLEDQRGSPAELTSEYEMPPKVPEDSPSPDRNSAAQAARILLAARTNFEAGTAEGAGKRLVRAFLGYFVPRPELDSRRAPQNRVWDKALHLRIS